MLDNEEIEEDDSLTVNLDESQEVEQDEVIENESDNIEETEDSEEHEEEEDEEDLVVTIGDEEPEVEEKLPDSKLVNFLRKADRKKSKEIRDLKRQLESTVEKKPAETLVLGAKPTIEGCEWDTAKYDKQYEEWLEKKRLVNQQKVEKEQEQKTQTEQWKKKQQHYVDLKAELKVKNFDEAEDVVKEKLGVNEQGIILHATKNPALVVYALSRNVKKLDELSKIKDPIVFAYKLAELEGQLKVSGRKAKPAPETTLKSSGGASTQSDKGMERLRDKCIKLGDMTEYHNAKRAKRKK